MLFTINNKYHTSAEQLRAKTLLNAYYVIKNYPLHAADLILDQYIQQQYKVTLKTMCITLLLNLTFYKDNNSNLIPLFKDPQYEKIARLITYGNGAIPGSQILQIALSN